MMLHFISSSLVPASLPEHRMASDSPPAMEDIPMHDLDVITVSDVHMHTGSTSGSSGS